MSEADDAIATLEECYRHGLIKFIEYAKSNWKLSEQEASQMQEGAKYRDGWNSALDSLDGCLGLFFEEFQY